MNTFETFRYFYYANDIDVIKRQYNVISRNLYVGDVFVLVCSQGHRAVAGFILGKNEVTHKYQLRAFSAACGNNHIDVAKWLASIVCITSVRLNTAIYEASDGGHINVVKWLTTFNPDINVDNVFINASSSGNVELAKYLMSWRDVDLTDVINDAFGNACINGHLDMVKWLSSLGHKINHLRKGELHHSDGSVEQLHQITLKTTCFNGHYELARWIYNNFTPKFDVDSNNGRIFRDLVDGFYTDATKRKFIKWIISLYDGNNLRSIIEHCYRVKAYTYIKYIIKYHDVKSLEIDDEFQARLDETISKIQSGYQCKSSIKTVSYIR